MTTFTTTSNNTAVFTGGKSWVSSYTPYLDNSGVISSISSLIRDARLVDASFTKILEDITTILMAQSIDAQISAQIKELFRPMLFKLKAMETDESEYLLDQCKAIILKVTLRTKKTTPIKHGMLSKK